MREDTMTEGSAAEIQSDKKTYWQTHVQARQELKVTRSQYCRERGLSISAMGYWDEKLLRRSGVPAKVRTESRFAPVTLSALSPRPDGIERIDPVWLARFLRALM